jgi:hypothetical protein
MAFVRSYVVPEGFPDSVTPSYVPYMTWRALKVQFRAYVQYSLSSFKCIVLTAKIFFTAQHFFGGAMGVFTTRTLLSSVGVSQSKVTPGAIAINWILKVKESCMPIQESVDPLTIPFYRIYSSFEDKLQICEKSLFRTRPTLWGNFMNLLSF